MINKTEQVFCNGDCFELLPKIYKENSFDLILVDPPYMINYVKWDKKFNIEFLSSEFYRILKPNGNLIFFAGWSNVCEVINKFDKRFILNDWIIYDRIKGRGAKRKLVSTREDILWFIKSKDYTFNKLSSTIKKKTKGMGIKNGDEFRKLSNVWTDISPIVPWSKERVNHPTQKPLQLIERIIEIFSNEYDTVLDCFMGSGTTLIACKNLNRNCCGIDINNDYCNIATERLKRTQRGGEKL